jgi:hypothetical protein
MRDSRWWITGLVASLLLWGSIAGGAETAVGEVPNAEITVAEPPVIEVPGETARLWDEIAVLQALNRLQFTSEQATEALKAVELPLTELASVRARQNSPSVHKALRQVRELLLNGQAVPLELWQQACPEGRLGLERQIVAEDQYMLASQAAEAFVDTLHPLQVRVLAERERYEQGERVVGEALEMWQSRDEVWEGWLEGIVEEAVETYAFNLPEETRQGMRDKLQQVARQVRESKGQLTVEVIRQLVGTVAEALQPDTEIADAVRRRQAQVDITPWFLQLEIVPLLQAVEKAQRPAAEK